jgi:hypothetical protein
MWTLVCSVFGENHVPCTLKTESETKSSPGFSIDIISDILSEWMLPFFYSKWPIFTAISYDGSNLHFCYLRTYIVDLYSANPPKHWGSRHAATLTLTHNPESQTHLYCLLCEEAVFGLTQSPLGHMIYRTRYGHDSSPFYHRCGSAISNFAPNRKLLFQWHCTYSHFLKVIR